MNKCLECGKDIPEGDFCDNKCLNEHKQIGGSHYKKKSIQPWHIINEYNLDFYLGNALKYLLRDKDDKIEDLEKAVHYLQYRITMLKEEPRQPVLCEGMKGHTLKAGDIK